VWENFLSCILVERNYSAWSFCFISKISNYWKSRDYDGTKPQLEKVENMPNIILA
jgi:hypothetical protein